MPSVDIVDCDQLRFKWPGPAQFGLSIDNFRMGRGQHVLLVGPSGQGKSTLLSLLAGIVTPQHGRVSVLGTDLAKLSRSGRDRFRAAHLGIIFQQFNLLPYASVIDNVMLPLHFSRERRARATASRAAELEAQRLLRRLGLDEASIMTPRASELSVGQQQRVAAARALIGSPELIIADEPTSSLDRQNQIAFLDLLFADLDTAGTSLIMVSHDETLAHRFNRVVRLDDIAKVEPERIE